MYVLSVCRFGLEAKLLIAFSSKYPCQENPTAHLTHFNFGIQRVPDAPFVKSQTRTSYMGGGQRERVAIRLADLLCLLSAKPLR